MCVRENVLFCVSTCVFVYLIIFLYLTRINLLNKRKNMIISAVSLKGGAGKTTVSINIAVHFATLGKKVILVDADVNNNIKRFFDNRDNFQKDKPVIDFAVLNEYDDFKRKFDELTAEYDVVIVDARPAIDNMTALILTISDYAIIPIKPSPLDMWTNDDVFIDTYLRALIHNPTLKAGFVMNCVKPKTNLAYECRLELMEYKETTNIKLFEMELDDRIPYAESLAFGLGVLEYKDMKARAEMRLFLSELTNHINE